MIDWHKSLSLYFIAGTQDILPNETLVDVLEEAIQGGITCFQFREKGKGSIYDRDEKIALARILQKKCKDAKIPFIVNDDVDLAILLKSDAVHVGQDDLSIIETIARMAPLGIEVGLSTNTSEQLIQAGKIKGLSYVGVGPVFPTQSKEDAKASLGIDKLSEMVKLSPNLPKVAIGGINQTNSREVYATKVDGIAVISAITRADNRIETIKKMFLDKINY